MKNLDIKTVEAAVRDAYQYVKSIQGGANASYIPYLANVDSALFGISVCLPSGESFSIGDSGYMFGIESVSKVHTAALIMNQHGADEVMNKIGADATGMPFNSIMAILLENDHPSNPLVNAGAITACSMVKPIGSSQKKWSAITNFMTELCGSPLTLIDELYKSESETNYNNKAIAWLLKNYGRIYDDPELSLDLYTRQCSMGVTTEQLAITGATIAASGRNPKTGKQVFRNELTTHLMSLITSVGFYEHTGDWIYSSGIPAKSGVGGGIMGVLPGVMGIAAFSPQLDSAGNSVKAQEAIKFISRRLGLNIFSPQMCEKYEVVEDYVI